MPGFLHAGLRQKMDTSAASLGDRRCGTSVRSSGSSGGLQDCVRGHIRALIATTRQNRLIEAGGTAAKEHIHFIHFVYSRMKYKE